LYRGIKEFKGDYQPRTR